MIEIGKKYWFSYCVEDENETQDDIEILIYNDGLNCIVIGDAGEGKYGHLYEVESDTGSQFDVYEQELRELRVPHVEKSSVPPMCRGCINAWACPSHEKCQGCSRMYTDNFERGLKNEN
jgi:hypothetical protein